LGTADEFFRFAAVFASVSLCLELPNRVNEVAERKQVRAQLPIQKHQQQAGERDYNKIFQNSWLERL